MVISLSLLLLLFQLNDNYWIIFRHFVVVVVVILFIHSVWSRIQNLCLCFIWNRLDRNEAKKTKESTFMKSKKKSMTLFFRLKHTLSVFGSFAYYEKVDKSLILNKSSNIYRIVMQKNLNCFFPFFPTYKHTF